MSAQQEFWKWFLEHEDVLFQFENSKEATFEELAKQLNKVDPDLTFEFGPIRDGMREFILSAGGIKRAFQAVLDLAAEAPELPRWNIRAFRPQRAVLNKIEFRGKQVHPKDVRFSLLHNGKAPGIYLFLPGPAGLDVDLRQIGYLMLDEALGEFDVETKVGLIKMFSSSEAGNFGETLPIQELPFQFEQLLKSLT
jgi:hypothetical protein